MQDRPNLCWAAVWFGIAMLYRLGWGEENPHHTHAQAWVASAVFLLPCCWFLLQHWLDKREASRPPPERPAEWGRRRDLRPK